MSTSTKGNNQHEASSRFGKVKPLVIFIIGVICSFGLAKWPIKGEMHWLSVMGQTLQLFGTFTVAWKISVRIRQHKGDLSLKNVVEWLVNFSGSTFPEPYQDQSQVLLSWISEDKGTSCESSTITKHNLPENDILRLSKTVETLEEKLESFIAADVSGQFKMDINGHEKSPQNGQVKEEKSSPTRIGLVSATNPPIRGVSKLEESGDHCEYTRVPRSGTDQESYSSALGA